LLKEAIAAGVNMTMVNALPAPAIIDVARLGLAAEPSNAAPRPIYLKEPDVKPGLNKALPRATS
jgi:hypothetical protein